MYVIRGSYEVVNGDGVCNGDYLEWLSWFGYVQPQLYMDHLPSRIHGLGRSNACNGRRYSGIQ